MLRFLIIYQNIIYLLNNLNLFILTHGQKFSSLLAIFAAILVIIFVSGYETISLYYKANPYINGIILLTLIVGFLLYTVKIISLSSEYRFMNSVAFGKLKINDSSLNSYPITKSIAKNLGIISSSNTISKTLDEILDELLSNIESGKDISKYLINLAVFLGLIGTFYGLFAYNR